jgi:hypothetical protein
MGSHKPYRELLNREPDFVVQYELAPCEELRNAKPTQGMRVDFLYAGESPEREGIHMIWPEILSPDGGVMMDTTVGAVPPSGKANMWVVSDERRSFHASKIKVGTKGYWVRGSLRLANVVVVEVCSLAC